MNKLDFEEVAKHINILNVAYHLSLEITDTRGFEVKAICPFCGYNKLYKIATLSLNTSNNNIAVVDVVQEDFLLVYMLD